MAHYLLVIGHREALGWLLTEQRMAFPEFARAEVRALAPHDTLFPDFRSWWACDVAEL